MKNNIKTLLINALLIIVGLATNPFTAYCQTSIDGIIGAYTNTSIIRYLDQKTVVVYKHNGTIGSFSVVDLISGIEKITDIHHDVNVNDFEIYNKKIVFFCGENTAQKCGCVGWFDINDIVNNTGFISYHDITPQSQTETIRAFNKMDYFVDTSATPDYLHLAATTYFHNIPYNTYSYGMTDVVIDLSNMTIPLAEYYNEYSSVERYDDIVATDNNLVAVIYKIDGNGQYVRKYNAVTSIIASMLSNPIYFHYCNWGNVYWPEAEQSFITHIGKDSVATAFIAEYGGAKGIGICIFNAAGAPPILLSNAFIPLVAPSVQTCNITDFVYDKSLNTFIVLFNRDSYTRSEIILSRYNAGVWTPYYLHYDNTVSMKINSIDKHILPDHMSGYLTTTNEPYYLTFDIAHLAHCLKQREIPLLFPTIYDGHAESKYTKNTTSHKTYLSTIQSNVINTTNICH